MWHRLPCVPELVSIPSAGFAFTMLPEEITRMPTVSILMAVHNGEAYLSEAVDSLLQQTFTDFELVIVDDASTDNTPRLLESLAGKDSRIVRLRNEANCGLAGALNRGLAICRAPLIARADADDVFVPDRLQKQVSFMQAHPNVGVLGAAVEFIDEHGLPREDRLNHFLTTPEDLRFHTHLGCCFWHTVVMFRSELVRSVGGYDEKLIPWGEDHDLWARLLDKTSFANLPDVLAKQRLHGASLTASWGVGFKLYCSVSQRLLSRYLGRALGEQEAIDAVTLFGWSRPMTPESVLRGIRLLREFTLSARTRETPETLTRFEHRCAGAFLTEAEIMVYAAPDASRRLLREAIRWWPAALFLPRSLMLVARMATPRVFREAVKRARRSVLGSLDQA
jgi:glycosyltransferase involved in cell wall biosynthesis